MYFHELMISILRIPNRVNSNKPSNYWQRLINFVILIFTLFDINTNVSRKWIVKKNYFYTRVVLFLLVNAPIWAINAQLFFLLILLLEKIPLPSGKVLQKYRKPQTILNWLLPLKTKSLFLRQYFLKGQWPGS